MSTRLDEIRARHRQASVGLSGRSDLFITMRDEDIPYLLARVERLEKAIRSCPACKGTGKAWNYDSVDPDYIECSCVHMRKALEPDNG